MWQFFIENRYASRFIYLFILSPLNQFFLSFEYRLFFNDFLRLDFFFLLRGFFKMKIVFLWSSVRHKWCWFIIVGLFSKSLETWITNSLIYYSSCTWSYIFIYQFLFFYYRSQFFLFFWLNHFRCLFFNCLGLNLCSSPSISNNICGSHLLLHLKHILFGLFF